jgi:hypothetical protein
MTTKRALLLTILAALLVVLVIGLMPREEVRHERQAAPLRVVVLAVDGLDWFLLGRYAEQGRLPGFATLLGSGVSGEIVPDPPTFPEISWTTLASGRAAVPSDAPGRPPRRYGAVPRLADLVSDAGGSVLVVDWPASWPAAARDFPIVAGFAPRAEIHENELAQAVFPSGTGHVSDDGFEALVLGLAREDENDAEEAFEAIIDLSAADTRGWEDHLAAARWSHLADRTALDVGVRLMAGEQPDLTMLYLGGLDAVSHRFLAPATPEFFPQLPAEALRFEQVLPAYYEFIDRAVRRILRVIDDQTVLVVCSAYGFHPSLDTPRVSGSHAEGPPGVFIVRGPRIAPLPEPVELSIDDVAPTVLALLGVMIPDDIDGRVVIEATPAGHTGAFPPTFGQAAATDIGTTEEPEGLARIRSAAAERLAGIRAGIQ